MPVYQVGEHEILKEEASYGYAENEYYDGMLYLSDKRLVFEKKGKRGLIHATPPQVVLDVQLHEISNISSAVPKIKVFTKKVLTVEYQSEKDVLKARFLLPDPSKWETEIRKWIADSKRQEEERIKREQDEIYRKRVEMARAKSGTTNVGVAYYGKPGQNNQSPTPPRQKDEDIIEGDSTSTSMQVSKQYPPATKSEKTCPSCGEPVKPGMKFCPSCGEPLK